MTKLEYLTALEQELRCFPADFAEDILKDYREHFRLGQENGKTEQQICEELGNVHEFAKELKEAEPDLAAAGIRLAPAVLPGSASGEQNKATGAGAADNSCDDQNNVPGYDCRRVQANFTSADVIVRRSPDGLAHAYYRNRGSLDNKLNIRFDCHQEGDTLYLSLEENAFQKRSLFGFASFLVTISKCDISILIELPEKFQDVSIRTKSGDIRAEKISAQKFLAESFSGDIHTDSCEVEVMALKTKSGDMELRNCLADEFQGSLLSGDVSINSCRIGRLNLSSLSGDISGRDNAISQAEVSGTSGDLTICGSLQKGDLYSVSGDISLYLENKTPSELNIRNTSGDTNIRLAYAGGLNARTSSTSGDMEIRYNGQRQRASGIPGRSLTLNSGSEPAFVTVKSVSGDIRISEA